MNLQATAAHAAANDAELWTVKQASDIVSDLQHPSPVIYWTDFLLSVTAAWGFTALYFLAPAWSFAQIAGFLAAGVLFFRAGTFIHEIIHFKRGEMRWFRRAWNALMGIPLLMPWIFYRNHLDHHSALSFGTRDDGEYLPLASAPVREIFIYLAQAPSLPLQALLRFGLLGPVSWLMPRLRAWVLSGATAAVSNPYYRKPFPQRDLPQLVLVEALCFGYLLALIALLGAGVIGWKHIGMGYLLVACTLTLNWVRNLAAHRYGNRGERMSHAEQFVDSINVTGQTWLTILIFPVGLRYHALHHLFPALPYHNLGEAHRRLSAQLPAHSPYHTTNRSSFFAAAAELWRAARRTPADDSAMSHWRRRSAQP